jgi:hypothetical protein
MVERTRKKLQRARWIEGTRCGARATRKACTSIAWCFGVLFLGCTSVPPAAEAGECRLVRVDTAEVSSSAGTYVRYSYYRLLCFEGAGAGSAGIGGGGRPSRGGGGGGVASDSPGDFPEDTPEERQRQNIRCGQKNADCGGGGSHKMACCFYNTRYGDECTTCNCGSCCISVFGGSRLVSMTRACQLDCRNGFSGGEARGTDNPDECEGIWYEM